MKTYTSKRLPVQSQQNKHQKKMRNVFKVDNKDTTSFLVSLLLTFNIFHSFSSISIDNFEHVFVCRATTLWKAILESVRNISFLHYDNSTKYRPWKDKSCNRWKQLGIESWNMWRHERQQMIANENEWRRRQHFYLCKCFAAHIIAISVFNVLR